MKLRFLLLLGICCLYCGLFPASAQKRKQKPKVSTAVPADTALERAITDLYAVISGPAGQRRDWVKFKQMFAPNAQMAVVYQSKEGIPSYKPITPEEYIATSGKYVEENGFFETELLRKTERFGNLVHVWSTYEARQKETDEKPMRRGINSIQFVKMSNGYKVASLVWQPESEELLLPASYLPKKK